MIMFPVMPFATTLQPPLAIGQFKAQFVEAGIPCQVELFYFDFMATLGLVTYELIGKLRGVNAQLGEWLFARQVWDDAFGPSDEEFFASCPVEIQSLRHPDPKRFLLQVRDEIVPEFLDRCCAKVLAAKDLRAVGFSCLFFQTMPSAALARRLKRARPDLPIAFGGASFHGEMGEELIRAMPWIDVVSIGEADDVIVPLFQKLSAGKLPFGLQGLMWRDHDGKIHRGTPHLPATAAVLEKLPTPDYHDYFAQADQHGMLANADVRERIFIPYESSRGCWWGQKQHCKFCGLNADGMNYRAKSADRSLELLRELYRNYPTRHYMATDNIMPHHYYNDFLPRLANDPMAKDIHLFLELKPNITRERVRKLAAAGVRSTVPGIESLSTHLLECLHKGTTALMSVRTLKLFREYSIMPGWSILMRIPGETQEDYDAMSEMIPSLVHLWPPFGGPRSIELHRFSPYFFEAGRYTRDVRPQHWYASVFPENRVDAAKVAYYFEAEWNDVLPPDAYESTSRRVWQWMDIWTRNRELPHFRHVGTSTDGPLELSDTRMGKHRVWQLDAREADIYRSIDEPVGIEALLARHGGDAAAIMVTLDDFVSNRLALREGGLYMALALPADSTDPTLQERRAALQRVEQEAERDLP
jgi:ribosomal peptide maturation radical SAM protein 1